MPRPVASSVSDAVPEPEPHCRTYTTQSYPLRSEDRCSRTACRSRCPSVQEPCSARGNAQPTISARIRSAALRYWSPGPALLMSNQRMNSEWSNS